MRFVSGVTTKYMYFVAVDATDFTTRETGFSSFTVYRSRNGGAAAAMTTPTINETDSTNMPGVYELLLDEDMTIDAGDDSQEMCFHITHAGMAPVSRTIELYRPKITLGQTITAANGAAEADLTYIHGTALTETSGQLAGRFVNFFDRASATYNVATALASFKATGFSTHDAAAVITALGTGSTLTDCATATGFLNAAGVRSAVGLASANIDTQLADIPTVAELEARTLGATSYFDSTSDTVDLGAILGTALTETSGQLAGRFKNFFDQASATHSVATALTDFKATGFSTHDTAAVKAAMEADSSKLDHLWEMTEDDGGVRRLTENSLEQAPSGTGASAAAIRAEMDSNSTKLAAIKTKTDLITSANITVTSAVVSDGDIELVQYDDYLNANSRALSWQNTSGDWFAGDLTDATVALTLVKQDETVVLTKAGSVVTATGTQEVSVELTAANTALFTLPGKQYRYQLLLVKATYRETEVTGDVIMTLTNNEPD